MNYSRKKFLGDRTYENYDEYLEDLRLYILMLLKNYIVNTYAAWKGNWKQADSTLPSYDEAIRCLELELQRKDIDEDQDIQDWYSTVTVRRELTKESGVIYPVDEIAERLSLGEFGVLILVITMMISLNRKYQRILSFINTDQNIRYPNLELCIRLFKQQDISELRLNSCINPYAAKIQILFPELAFASNLMITELVCDERLIDLLLGEERYYTKGISIAAIPTEQEPLFFREQELQRLLQFEDPLESPLFMLCGDRGAGKKYLTRHIAAVRGAGVVYLDVKSCLDNQSIDMNSVMVALRFAARECLHQAFPLAITGLELLQEHEMEQLIHFIHSSIKPTVPTIFLLMNQEHYSTAIEGLYITELEIFNELQRIELWKYYTKDYVCQDNLSLDELANTFLITPGQMIGAIRQASLFSGTDRKTLQIEALYKACYAQLDHKLQEKSRKVNTKFTWTDLKLPDSEKEILRDICNCVKNKHIVMNEWNFSKIIPYGAGLSILFTGPPGTGKTMAAQVIANELRMELYKIDLSQIIDKYVGETEKNIKQIFEQAKKSNSILFFDEADAIFNKRLEASNSNDRFANIESSLLLQCVEEYSGISILATNNYNAIDAAFIRRFKYFIPFREPDEAMRYEIWKSVIPKEAPVSNEVDLKLLAKQFQFTGAVIKNVIISSAYLAAEKGEAISLTDILISIKREMFKNNLILTKEKLGSLAYMFEDIK